MPKTGSKSKRRASNGTLSSGQSQTRHNERTPLAGSERSSQRSSASGKKQKGYGPGGETQVTSTSAGPSGSHAPNVHFDDDSFDSSDGDWADDYPRIPNKTQNTRTPPNVYLIPNVSSVARDHMALERTFLSYVRSALGIAAAGVALVQLLTVKGYYLPQDPDSPERRRWNKIDKYARPLGAVTVAFSLLILLAGTRRFFHAQSSLLKGLFPIGRMTISFIATGLAALIIVTFTIITITSRVIYAS